MQQADQMEDSNNRKYFFFKKPNNPFSDPLKTKEITVFNLIQIPQF